MLKALKVVALLALLPLLPACAEILAEQNNTSGVRFYKHVEDKFDGSVTDSISNLGVEFGSPGNLLNPFASLPTSRADLLIVRGQLKAGATPFYSLSIDYNAKDWIFISSGQSLTFLLDGANFVRLSGTGSASDRKVSTYLTGAGIDETATYQITRAQLQQIASASKVELKLTGDHGAEEGSMKPVFVERIGKFLALFKD
jgi:hypothetical protein